MKLQITKTKESVNRVSTNIKIEFQRKQAAAVALASSYSILVLNYFRQEQSNGRFWINRTQQALIRVFSEFFSDETSIGFFLAHGVDYGVYLELANNRKHEALRPIIKLFSIKFVQDLRKIF